jgi:ribonucleoside-diphosphate reductase alpha chain
MSVICHTAYRTSIALAEEKGSFPYLDHNNYLEGQFIRRLPEDIRDGVAKDGIRNSHLIAIAPTGTISLLAGNVSSGLEQFSLTLIGARFLTSMEIPKSYA